MVPVRISNKDVRPGERVSLPLGCPVFVDTTDGPISVHLPVSASSGDVVMIIDEGGSFGENPLRILGGEEEIIANVSFCSFSMIFHGGWHFLTRITKTYEEDRNSEEWVAKEVGRMAKANLEFIGG
jgi:hypothetical protein